jgi:hypothetical protein
MRNSRKSTKTMFGVGLAVLFLLALTTTAFGGGSGEGVSCDPNLTYANLNPPYTGTLIAEYRCYPCGIWVTTIAGEPLTRQGGKCTIDASTTQVFVGPAKGLPVTPSDIRGFCTQGFVQTNNDSCSYDALLYGHVVIDASTPKILNGTTVMFNVKLMPLTVAP